jgi:DNA replication protein DnaC
MSDYSLRAYMPSLVLELATMPSQERERTLAAHTALIDGDRIHFPMAEHERLTERDRLYGVLMHIGAVQRRSAELLGKHRLKHLFSPIRDGDNADVFDALMDLELPGATDDPLVVVLSGPNSTGKSLLAASTALRLLRSEVQIRSTTRELRTVVLYGVSRPAPALVHQGRRLVGSFERQEVVWPPLEDIVFVRDPDFLRDIQQSYGDTEAPTEAAQISALAGRRVVVIEDLGWRHGGKPEFPRRVWSDFFDQRESTRGTITIISTNLTDPDGIADHIDMRGWERLGGMLKRNGGWFDVRGQSRRMARATP